MSQSSLSFVLRSRAPYSSSSIKCATFLQRRTCFVLNARRPFRPSQTRFWGGCVASASKSAAADEKSAYKKREEESKAAGIRDIRPPSGGDPPPSGKWQWTLNWDPITDGEVGAGSRIIVGSCPRTAEDIKRLQQEAGVEAIISFQSDVCLEAMGVDFHEGVMPEALRNDILYARVPVFDFDRIDQAAMLPEMVRKLALLVATGRRTYVHCTAGINRANLAVLGYLTFVEGMRLEEALSMIKEARPQANPYVDCWRLCRSRLLAGKEHDIYLLTQETGNSMEEGGDWIMRDWERAQTNVISAHFKRIIQTDLEFQNTVARMSMLQTKRYGEAIASPKAKE